MIFENGEKEAMKFLDWICNGNTIKTWLIGLLVTVSLLLILRLLQAGFKRHVMTLVQDNEDDLYDIILILLRKGDQMIREADRLMGEAIRRVAELYQEDLIPKPAHWAYAFPGIMGGVKCEKICLKSKSFPLNSKKAKPAVDAFAKNLFFRVHQSERVWVNTVRDSKDYVVNSRYDGKLFSQTASTA
jgi:hypothetical protein